MTVDVLDSAYPPNASQIAAAMRDGVKLWGGYLATRAGSNLLRPWTKTDFDSVRALSPGSLPIAYCSGWDDPAAIRQVAADWRVRPILDVEYGIRSDGPWVQDWLNASGAGLYANPPVHAGRTAACHVAAIYPTSGDSSGASWPAGYARPPGPCGWQWAGTHDFYGVGVDQSWFDSWFVAAAPAPVPVPIPAPPPEEDMKLLVDPSGAVYLVGGPGGVAHIPGPPSATLPQYGDLVAALGQPVKVSAITISWLQAQVGTASAGGLTPAQAQQLSDIQAKVDRDLA